MVVLHLPTAITHKPGIRCAKWSLGDLTRIRRKFGVIYDKNTNNFDHKLVKAFELGLVKYDLGVLRGLFC